MLEFLEKEVRGENDTEDDRERFEIFASIKRRFARKKILNFQTKKQPIAKRATRRCSKR